MGNVAEADIKRFRDQREYLKNAHVDQFNPPIVYTDDEKGSKIAIAANEAAYRFCFVEKNRIDSFSRIAAQAPAKQTELISTLFGLESFTEFVRNFTPEIDDRYIDITGQQSSLLKQKQQALLGAQQQIQSSITELVMITAEEVSVANEYKLGSSFEQTIQELFGSEEEPGRIARLELDLQEPIGVKSNLTKVSLQSCGNSITSVIQQLNDKQQKLIVASQQVSFKNLYDAITLVHPSSPDACPACKTPLAEVVVNPYSNANQELQKLQGLATIQNDALQLEQNAKQLLFQLSQVLNTCLLSYPIDNLLKKYEVPNNGQPTIQWWNLLHEKLADGFTPWQHLVAQVQNIEDQDKQIDLVSQLKVSKQNELNTLREYSRRITALQAKRAAVISAKITAQQLIENFQKQNAQLIADVETEKSVILKNKVITNAYSTFVQKLNAYSNNLPAKLVADLGEMVVSLYNAFNRNDVESELLSEVKLPLAQNQRLEIAFKNKPDKYFDALHVLSEGHIRCLGLAILLAKNLKENAPVLIFDDPVNAIDDDHRESIRRTLFEDQYFSSKQIILTCHGEEFFKDIQNLLSVEAAKHAKSFSFLPRLGDPHIRIDFDCAPRNYIISARRHIERNEVREALSKSRQALESLTKGKVWRYVSKYGDGNLSLKLRSSSAPIELRNLTEQLKSKIAKDDFADAEKSIVFTPIDSLLGLNGDSREWRYLNKGTHEEVDRSEFDRVTVQTIVKNLEQLDAALE